MHFLKNVPSFQMLPGLSAARQIGVELLEGGGDLVAATGGVVTLGHFVEHGVNHGVAVAVGKHHSIVECSGCRMGWCRYRQ